MCYYSKFIIWKSKPRKQCLEITEKLLEHLNFRAQRAKILTIDLGF